jgi:hypothetical protein
VQATVLLAVLLLTSGCAMPATTPDGASGIRGRALVGPTCPVERDPPDPGCADRPYHGALAVAAASDGHMVASFETDAEGNFTVAVAPGEYTVRNVDGPRCCRGAQARGPSPWRPARTPAWTSLATAASGDYFASSS